MKIATVTAWYLLAFVWASMTLVYVLHGHFAAALIPLSAAAFSVYSGNSLAMKLKPKPSTKGDQNGADRRSVAEVHSDSTQSAGSGNAGAETFGAVAVVTRPRVTRAVEDTGLIVGEVEAFRCWQIVGDHLASMNGAIWLPGKPMTGFGVDSFNSSGVHAFNTIDEAKGYAHATPCAIGRVHLWGIVIEHETGYRAEFARPVEIMLLIDPNGRTEDVGLRAAISQRYGLEQ